MHQRSWLLFAPLLAAGAVAQAAQFTPSQIPIPSGSGFGQLDNVYPFESGAYFRGTKTTSGGVGTYTLEASNKASNVGLSGANKTLTWWADGTHAFTVTAGIWDLNFRGTAVGTNPGNAVSGSGCKSPNSCSNTVSVWGTGISGSAANMAWLQSSNPGLYSAFTSSSTNRNLFTATLTNFDLFGETTSGTSDDAIAFKWVNATGALAPWADPFNFAYLGKVKTSNFLGSKTTYTTTGAIQHTNVPVPGAVYLFGSALLFLRRKALGGQGLRVA
jgi:hypothetical protein